MLPWIWSGGGDIANPGLTSADGYLNGPKSVAAVQMLVNLYKEGEIPNLLIGNKGAVQTQDGLPKGVYADILDGPWMAAIWQAQYKAFQPVYSSMPAGPGGSISVVGGEDIVMTSSSKNQAADEEFIAFTQSPRTSCPWRRPGRCRSCPRSTLRRRRPTRPRAVHQAAGHGEVPAGGAGLAADRHRAAGRSDARVPGQGDRSGSAGQGGQGHRSVADRHEVRIWCPS